MDIALRVRRLWRSITEPRHLKTFYLVVYILAVWVGLVTLVNPPSSIEGQLGDALTRFWASLITLGGIGGAVSVLPGWWWVERCAVWLILTGAAIYGGIVIYIQALAPPGSSRWTQIGFIAFACALFILRLLLTRKWDYEPRG